MQPGCKLTSCNLNSVLSLPYSHFRGKSHWEDLLLEPGRRLNKKFDYILNKGNGRAGLRGRTRNYPDKARISKNPNHLQSNE